MELRVDPHTISLVIDSQAFVATDLKLNLSSQYLLKVIDPFQVIWLLSIKEFSDGLRYLPSCTKVSPPFCTIKSILLQLYVTYFICYFLIRYILFC